MHDPRQRDMRCETRDMGYGILVMDMGIVAVIVPGELMSVCREQLFQVHTRDEEPKLDVSAAHQRDSAGRHDPTMPHCGRGLQVVFIASTSFVSCKLTGTGQ